MIEILKNIIKTIIAVFKDLKSKEKIIINRWHLHTLGISPFAIIFAYGSLFFNFQEGLEKIAEYIIPILGLLGISFGLEFYQQKGRIIDEKERFESNKDGTFTTLIGTLIFIIFRLIFFKLFL